MISANWKEKILFYITIIGVLLWFIINYSYGDHLNVNDGYGWDGKTYAEIAIRFMSFIHHGLLDNYRVRRIFPSFIVFLSSKILGYSLNVPANVVHAFYCYNVLLIFSAMVGLYLIARLQNWTFPVCIVAFSALFLNYGVLKMTTYYTVLTDYSAFAIGLWMVYFYLRDTVWGLILVTIIGGFTYSMLSFCGFLLLFFPRENSLNRSRFTVKLPIKIAINPFWISGIVGFIFCISAIHFLGTYHPSEFSERYRTLMVSYIGPMTSIHSMPMGVASVLGLFFYILFALKPFIKSRILIYFTLRRVMLALTIFLGLTILQRLIANPQLAYMTFSFFFPSILMGALSNPLIFLLGDFIYYGPVVLFIIFFWPEIVALSYQYGLGFTALLGVFVIIGIVPESRDIFNVVPLFVFLLCDILNKKNISVRFGYCFMLLSLLMSKFWLPMNHYAWAYSMSQGQAISDQFYFIQASVMIMMGIVFYHYKRKMHLRESLI